MAWIWNFVSKSIWGAEENIQVFLNEPWRNVIWDTSKRTTLKQSVEHYKPQMDTVPKARILLVGAAGSGKSSFFNSINSIMRGNITSQANAGEREHSVTTRYRTYQVKAGQDGRPLAFLLCDTMGVEVLENRGVNIEDINSILKGYIPDQYCFNPVSPFQPQAHSPSAVKDRIHCVVYVIDAAKCVVMPPGIKEKLRKIQRKVESYEIPQVVLLTNVEKACPIVRTDLKAVYHSCLIKDRINRASDFLGISVANVLPVKNYSYELELNEDSDILLLTALQKMLHFADNYLDNFYIRDTPPTCHI